MSSGRIRAPELPEGLEWFNTDRPLSLAGERGKVVLLDFWSYCCINCLHVLADLHYLERKYRDSLTVIGIHSPKFPNERVGSHVGKAINRHHVRHPVANDPDLTLWRQYGVRGWPSVAVIDPQGYLLGVMAGEGRRRQLDLLVQHQIAVAKRRGTLKPRPVRTRRSPEPESRLQFPSTVLAAARDRVFASDTGRNRVLQLTPDGRVVRTFGSGAPGFVDAGAEEASFDDPHGLALVGDELFVADRGNHAIRRIRLRSREVETVAGTGRQGRHTGERFRDPLKADLNSPWALCYHHGQIYIAMAGQHQVWRLDLTTMELGVYAGSGREALVDGPAGMAAFAQPSGLAAGPDHLYVADAESSAIRSLQLPDGYARTLVGEGLFEFGDVDGVGGSVRLQHPLGVTYDPRRNCLWIADTFNHQIKKLDLRTQRVSRLNLDHPLAEPGGVSVHEDTLWVASTNRHELVRIDLAGGRAQPLDLQE